MKTSHKLKGSNGRFFLADCFVPNAQSKAVVIFCHGFKGFKDWGTFPLMALEFVKREFAFVSFNFSHNGTTVDCPMEFKDLEAFGNNNFSKELDDLGTVIEFVFQHFKLEKTQAPIYLLGHSRGGGICILKAAEDNRISKLAVWGSVNEFGKFWKNKEMERLKREGVIYIPNARTNQQMPIYKQLYENYEANLDRLHIPTKVKSLKTPLLIVHGTNDQTVPYHSALELMQWKPDAELIAIENGNHTFGAKHPWTSTALPPDFKTAVEATLRFFTA